MHTYNSQPQHSLVRNLVDGNNAFNQHISSLIQLFKVYNLACVLLLCCTIDCFTFDISTSYISSNEM